MTLLSALTTLLGAGDLDAAMRNLADDVEWVGPGNSAISGVYRGRDEVARLLVALAERSSGRSHDTSSPDGDHVVVLTRVTADGQSPDQADVFTFGADRKVSKYAGAADTAFQERVWGEK